MSKTLGYDPTKAKVDDFTLDLERFPYLLNFRGKTIAKLFTHAANKIIIHAMAYAMEMNRLKYQVNELLDHANGKKKITQKNLKVIEYEDIVDTTLEGDANDMLQQYGVAIGQIWMSRRGKGYYYQVSAIDARDHLVELLWMGPWSDKKDIDAAKMERSYELQENLTEKEARAFGAEQVEPSDKQAEKKSKAEVEDVSGESLFPAEDPPEKIEVGQIWKSKRAKNEEFYEVMEVNKDEVVLKWVSPKDYERIVKGSSIARSYSYHPSAVKNAILGG